MFKVNGKKLAIVIAIAAMPSLSFAENDKGCGWGSMIFKGNSGLLPHLGAMTTNMTAGNASFGLTSGTNGCDSSEVIGYGGKAMIAQVMDEFAEDVAQGHGDALDAVAVSIGIQQQDRATFAQVTHKNFNVLFPDENVTAEQVMASINLVMKNDPQLAKYVA